MKIIAVDDEMLQLETIEEYVTELYPQAQFQCFTKVSDVLVYMQEQTPDLAILDISMPGNINGINLGEMLRQKNNRVKLLFCTGYSDYAMDAFKIHANGYLQKPVRKEDFMREMRYVLQMPVFGVEEKPYIHTFGNFDVFVDGIPVVFRRSKSKEILAYLTDREGSWVTNKELLTVLWEETGNDPVLSKYVTTLVHDMVMDLEAAGAGHIVERHRGRLRLLREEIACDYFDYLNKGEQAVARFRNEYMSQYSWGEETMASLLWKETKE